MITVFHISKTMDMEQAEAGDMGRAMSMWQKI